MRAIVGIALLAVAAGRFARSRLRQSSAGRCGCITSRSRSATSATRSSGDGDNLQSDGRFRLHRSRRQRAAGVDAADEGRLHADPLQAKGKSYRFVNVDSDVTSDGNDAVVRADGSDSTRHAPGSVLHGGRLRAVLRADADAALLEAARPAAGAADGSRIADQRRPHRLARPRGDSRRVEDRSSRSLHRRRRRLGPGNAVARRAAARWRRRSRAPADSSFEAVREDLEPALVTFVQRAARDGIGDLEPITAQAPISRAAPTRWSAGRSSTARAARRFPTASSSFATAGSPTSGPALVGARCRPTSRASRSPARRSFPDCGTCTRTSRRSSGRRCISAPA